MSPFWLKLFFFFKKKQTPNKQQTMMGVGVFGVFCVLGFLVGGRGGVVGFFVLFVWRFGVFCFVFKEECLI